MQYILFIQRGSHSCKQKLPLRHQCSVIRPSLADKSYKKKVYFESIFQIHKPILFNLCRFFLEFLLCEYLNQKQSENYYQSIIISQQLNQIQTKKSQVQFNYKLNCNQKLRMFQQSLSYLQQDPQQFNLQQVLLSLCKKSTIDTSSPEIDFLDFEQKLQDINLFHQKTCQDIVQFVDTHCGQYIEINGKFESLQQKIQKVENIIKLVSIKLKDYASVYYQDQGKIQEMITRYETSIIQKVLLSKCREEVQFLSQFVILFEPIISKSMDNLIFKQRALLIRFCYKFRYLQSLFNHHMVHQALPEYFKIEEMLSNLADEVQFYISQQLSKLIKYKSIEGQSSKDPKVMALNQIKLCYSYLNKLPDYYKNIEQSLIGREMQLAEKNLLANKINLIGGKNIEVVEEFFKAIFSSVNQFPKTYPRKRLLQLIFAQLCKNQVKFLYTYTLPIFPISYNYYMKYIDALDSSENQLKTALKLNHNWDLKRWVDVRGKNILDRCTKEWEKETQKQKETLKEIQTNNSKPKSPDLNKWIDIIFKENCKIPGVKNFVATLALKVVNKYALFIENSNHFDPEFLNKYIEIHDNIQKLIHQKLVFFFDASNENSSSQILSLIQKISLSCQKSLLKSIQRVVQSNTKLLSKSCCGCLEPFKTFIMKIIKSSKQLTQYGYINIFQNIFKPLTSYLQSNLSLSQESKKWIRKSVIREVMKFYDEIYVAEIYQYARTNLSVEQLGEVMAIVGKQRGSLFVGGSQ